MPIIPKEREAYFLILFLVQFIVWCFLVINQTELQRPITVTAVAIGKDMAPLAILTTATSIIVVEGVAMLAERYLRRRYREGREEGRQEGLAEGAEKNQKAWEEWNQRRLAAEAAGEPFSEPPPSLTASARK